MGKRTDQVNNLIRQELGEIVLREGIVPNDCLATIAGVKTTPDLREARVFLSIFPENKTKKIMELLGKNIGRLQFLLNKRLAMRPLPRISFALDETEKKARHLEELMG